MLCLYGRSYVPILASTSCDLRIRCLHTATRCWRLTMYSVNYLDVVHFYLHSCRGTESNSSRIKAKVVKSTRRSLKDQAFINYIIESQELKTLKPIMYLTKESILWEEATWNGSGYNAEKGGQGKSGASWIVSFVWNNAIQHLVHVPSSFSEFSDSTYGIFQSTLIHHSHICVVYGINSTFTHTGMWKAILCSSRGLRH